ncbi:Rrf2 family transcriptional regulator [Clostridium sp.]|uniref:RrF2 family transcriptional regulator n=1 Tax=Clostridium sp. TaxID=1506 RepID=UPI0026034060|nr:Rrf2 family transcriptional regulator [Clostridium sp.]
MYLSKFTDYSFRTLVYLAENKEKLATVEQLAKTLDVSEHHLKKVVHKLAKTGLIMSMKGRCGGLRLVLNPEDINLGKVLLITEDNLNIAKCFNEESYCPFRKKGCKLRCIMNESLNAFLNQFSKYTLKDLLKNDNKDNSFNM